MFKKQSSIGDVKSWGVDVPIDPNDPEAKEAAARVVRMMNNLAGFGASNDGVIDGVFRFSWSEPPTPKFVE